MMSPLSTNRILDQTPLSVFESIIAQLRSAGKKVIPLHQGKTMFTTPVALRSWEPQEFGYPPYHDGPTCGTEALLDAIRAKLECALRTDIDPGRIQVTNGSTHALSVVFHSLLAPGDEVILMSPQWLFADGLVRAAGGTPIEVPCFPVANETPVESIAERVASYVTSRTRAIYFNTPNNPTGRSLTAQQMHELAELASSRGFWIVADNAYEYYDYSRDGFIDAASLPEIRQHTFAAYSFSKSFGLTGYRIGYLLSPPAMAESVRKFALYSIYSVPTCTQFVALSALKGDPAFLAAHRAFIREALDLTMRDLHVPSTQPEGGFYTFLDLSACQAGVDAFISDCIRAGVSLAPGGAFGAHYRDHARLCYSMVGHEDLAEGIRIINETYERHMAR